MEWGGVARGGAWWHVMGSGGGAGGTRCGWGKRAGGEDRFASKQSVKYTAMPIQQEMFDDNEAPARLSNKANHACAMLLVAVELIVTDEALADYTRMYSWF